MKDFKDAKDTNWDITVNVGTAKAVKDLTGVNLFDLYASEAQKVFSDPCLLVNVIYVLCKKQAENRKISDVEFGERMIGDALEAASNALLLEVADFFPSGRRQVLKKMFEQSQTAAKQMEQDAIKKLESMDVASLLRSTKSQAS